MYAVVLVTDGWNPAVIVAETAKVIALMQSRNRWLAMLRCLLEQATVVPTMGQPKFQVDSLAPVSAQAYLVQLEIFVTVLMRIAVQTQSLDTTSRTSQIPHAER